MRLRKHFLVCGIVASLLYVGIDLLAAVRHGDYHSFISQTISELGARGSPTKQLVDPLYIVFDLLTIAFGAGVWLSAGGRRALRLIAASLIAIGVVGLPGPWLFPMNLRGSENVAGDIPHIVVTGVIVLFILTAVMAGAYAQGRRFRLYSVATFVILLVSGVLIGLEAPGIANGEPTPWIGLSERANIGAFLLWAALLAISLLRESARSSGTTRWRWRGRAGLEEPSPS